MTNQNNAAQAAQQHPIDQAVVILTEEADSLSECHTRTPGDWAGEPEAKARYDHILAVVDALSKLRAPVADEPPGGTRWPVLRAMARNYTAGKHTWDALDANACEQAAEEIRHLRAALASAPAANDLTPAGMKEICPECGHQFGCFHSPYIDKLRAQASAPVAGEAFMYGIMGPDGKAHFEEFCVSGDRTELQTEVVDHLNRDNPEDGTYSVVALFRDAAPQASAEAFDFAAHLARQAEFSALTFGPGARVAGICDHIRKELIEVETSGGDLKEWVDVIILGLDGAWRSGPTPQEIITAIVAKQAKNEARTWPDWRTVDPNKAIEHDRGGQP